MENDPTAYIVFAALLGAALGFMGCALVASARIRQAGLEGWKEGVRCAERERQQPRL